MSIELNEYKGSAHFTVSDAILKGKYWWSFEVNSLFKQADNSLLTSFSRVYVNRYYFITRLILCRRLESLYCLSVPSTPRPNPHRQQSTDSNQSGGGSKIMLLTIVFMTTTTLIKYQHKHNPKRRRDSLNLARQMTKQVCASKIKCKKQQNEWMNGMVWWDYCHWTEWGHVYNTWIRCRWTTTKTLIYLRYLWW